MTTADAASTATQALVHGVAKFRLVIEPQLL